MKPKKRARTIDEPFRESLARKEDETGVRQAQRLTHRLIRRTRRHGHHELADWFGAGFRSGRFTVDGASAEPAALARTLAALRVRDLVEMVDETGESEHGSAMLYFDRVDSRGEPASNSVREVDLLDIEAGELVAELRAATFGLAGDGPWYRLRYVGLCELAPDPRGTDGSGTLDLWDAVPPDDRSRRLTPGRFTLRVRFGWSDRDNFHLSRLQQVLTVRAAAGAPDRPRLALSLQGPPAFEPVSDSRQATDRWDRTILDGFVVNRTVGELVAAHAP